jgi:bifunctional ADP-heptose synthase (sugar kinase/adenylyltransferase)
MKKIETQWVLVETISTFRERYMVEVPVGVDRYGKDKADWALDTVTMEEAKEFSQEHLGETIVSHRVVTKEEALAMCDKENDYAKKWNDELKMKNFFTTMAEHIREDDYNDAT